MRKIYLIVAALAIACSSPKSDQETFSEQQREALFEKGGDENVDQSLPELEQTLKAQGLVDVEKLIPGIKVELKYSTTENFFGKDVYGDHVRCAGQGSGGLEERLSQFDTVGV